MGIEKFHTLRALRVATGIPVSTLRAEVRDGRLVAIRARDGRFAPVLVSDSAWQTWLATYAAKRVHTVVQR